MVLLQGKSCGVWSRDLSYTEPIYIKDHIGATHVFKLITQKIL